MRQLKFLIVFVAVISFYSCSKQQQQNVQKEVDTATTTVKKEIDTLLSSINPSDTIFNNVKTTVVDTTKLSSVILRKNINDIFAYYIDIKDDLADNDSAGAKSEAKDMMSAVLASLETIGPKNLDKRWKVTSEKIERAASEIESANTLQQQRTLFDKLSKSIAEVIQVYGLEDKTIYQLNCSNALSGKGGMWLADSKDSDNPYTGKNASNECAKVIAAWEFN
jgi:hypothetical protein